MKGKVLMFWARNTEFYEVSMCKDSCGLKRCAPACLSVRGTAKYFGFCSYTLPFNVTTNLRPKSFFRVSSRGQGSRKKVFKARQNQLFGWIYSGEKSKPPTSNNRYMEIFSYWKDPFWIIIVRSSIQPSPLDTAVLRTLVIDKDSSRPLQLSICYKCKSVSYLPICVF